MTTVEFLEFCKGASKSVQFFLLCLRYDLFYLSSRNLNGYLGRSGWRWLCVNSYFSELLWVDVSKQQVHHRRYNHPSNRLVRFPGLSRPSPVHQGILSVELGEFAINKGIFVSLHIDKERVLAYERLNDSSIQTQQPNTSVFSWSFARRVLTRWRWYACSALVSSLLFTSTYK